MVQKGNEIRFVRGKYIGLLGWINADEVNTRTTVPVIVSLPTNDDGSTMEKVTKVKKESVAPRQPPPPLSYTEAVLQQHPNIDKVMDQLMRQLAKCNISSENRALQNILIDRLAEANRRQNPFGYRAV
jgi:hypothetical protein